MSPDVALLADFAMAAIDDGSIGGLALVFAATFLAITLLASVNLGAAFDAASSSIATASGFLKIDLGIGSFAIFLLSLSVGLADVVLFVERALFAAGCEVALSYSALRGWEIPLWGRPSLGSPWNIGGRPPWRGSIPPIRP